MTLHDHNTLPYIMLCFPGQAVYKWMKTDTHYQQQNDSFTSVEFSDVQNVHKFTGRVTRSPDFKVMPLLNV